MFEKKINQMFVGDGEASVHTSMYNKTEQDNKTNEWQQESDQHRDDSNSAASPTPGDCQLLRRLQADVNSLSLVNSEQSQVLYRLIVRVSVKYQ